MNYIKEINAFVDWLETNPLEATTQTLWFHLMAIANKSGWPEWFAVANPLLMAKVGISENALNKHRNILEQKGRIEYKNQGKKKPGKYRIIPFITSKNEVNQEVNCEVIREVNREANCSALNNKLNETKQENIPYAEIVGYLNEKTGSSYKPTTKATQSHIKARWREGFRLEDFKAVIDNMTEKWGNDPKMSQYLRPETLFGTKFESYLNTKRRAQVSTTSRLPLVTLTPEQAAEMERIANAQRRA